MIDCLHTIRCIITRKPQPYAKLTKCQAYGMIYYYRTGEAVLTMQTDLQILKEQAQQTKLEWFEKEE